MVCYGLLCASRGQALRSSSSRFKLLLSFPWIRFEPWGGGGFYIHSFFIGGQGEWLLGDRLRGGMGTFQLGSRWQ